MKPNVLNIFMVLLTIQATSLLSMENGQQPRGAKQLHRALLNREIDLLQQQFQQRHVPVIIVNEEGIRNDHAPHLNSAIHNYTRALVQGATDPLVQQIAQLTRERAASVQELQQAAMEINRLKDLPANIQPLNNPAAENEALRVHIANQTETLQQRETDLHATQTQLTSTQAELASTQTQLTSTQAELASTQTQLTSTQRRFKWAKFAAVIAFAANVPQVRETANNLWIAGLTKVATWAPKK